MKSRLDEDMQVLWDSQPAFHFFPAEKARLTDAPNSLSVVVF
jgi:hypothetical protein